MDEHKEVIQEPQDEGHDEIRGTSIVNPFLGFIFDHWQLIMLVSVFSVAIGTYYTQKALIAHYKAAYNTEKELVDKYKSDNDTLAKEIADQSEKIQKFADASKVKDEVIQDLQKTVDSKQAAISDLRKKLDKKPVPQTCDESTDYLDNAVDQVQW